MDEETPVTRPRKESKIQGGGTGACGRNWGKVLRLMGCISMGSLGFVCVVDLLDVLSSFKLNIVCLDVFMVLFAVIGIFAELRSTELLAGIGYALVKHIYFITTYPGRAGWYIFLGTCNLDPHFKWYHLMAGGFTAGTGLFILFLFVFVRDLPKYQDDDKKKMEKGAGAKGAKKNKKRVGTASKDTELEAAGDDSEDSLEADRRKNENMEDAYYSGTKKREAMRKEADKERRQGDYKMANPFESGPPSATTVATTVVRNGDAPAVASAVARGDNVTAATTVAHSMTKPSPALYAEYEDDENDGNGNDDDELEKMYAKMRAN